MLSKSQTWTLDAGQTAHLECEFIADRFNLFDNPIIWRKRQNLRRRRSSYGLAEDVVDESGGGVDEGPGDEEEETQINMMGNLVEPFITAQRFRPTFHDRRGTSYIFGLTITSKHHRISYFINGRGGLSNDNYYKRIGRRSEGQNVRWPRRSASTA